MFHAVNTQPKSLVETARDLAKTAHEGQFRKGDTSLPYFVHVESVVAILANFAVTDETILAAAYLHDLLEDQPAFEPQMNAAMPAEVVAIVRCVTENKLDANGEKRPKEERFQETLAALKTGTEPSRKAIFVSFADQLDNARSLVASEEQGHALLGRMATAPDQKLRHLAELRQIYEGALSPAMLVAFDQAAADLTKVVKDWFRQR